MKFFFCFFIYTIALNVIAQKHGHVKPGLVTNYVNVFNQHLNTLDSMMKFGGDYSPECLTLVGYMERVTNLKAHPEFNCWGNSHYFTWVDLGLWNTWYKRIGSKKIL